MRGFNGRHRYVLVLVAMTTLIATGLWVQLGGATTTSTNPDTIQYVQTTGSSGTFIKYVPGDNSTPFTDNGQLACDPSQVPPGP